MKRDGFAHKVRVASRDLQDKFGRVETGELRDALDLVLAKHAKRLYHCLRDLARSGEMRRISPGVYAWVGKPEPPPRKQEIMWRFLRMQKNLTVDDLCVACDVSAAYADEYMRNLGALGLVKRLESGRYQIVKDQLETPVNDAKAQKLRDIRARKRAKIALALKRASEACAEAIRYLEDEATECK